MKATFCECVWMVSPVHSLRTGQQDTAEVRLTMSISIRVTRTLRLRVVAPVTIQSLLPLGTIY